MKRAATLITSGKRRAHVGERTSHSGFTLIELLVVVAIIGILTAILYPVFMRVREKGRMASCASNLKQIGLAVMQYCQDNDERMPRWGSNAAGDNMVFFLQPYTKTTSATTGLWACPSNNQDFPGGISYGYNYVILGSALPPGGVVQPANYTLRFAAPPVLANLLHPVDTVEFTDAWNMIIAPPYGIQKVFLSDKMGAWHQSSAFNDPQGWVNVLWCDGHVKPKRKGDLTPPKFKGWACSDDLWDRLQPSAWRITGVPPACP